MNDRFDAIFSEVLEAFLDDKMRIDPSHCPVCGCELLSSGHTRIHFAQHQNELNEIEKASRRRRKLN